MLNLILISSDRLIINKLIQFTACAELLITRINYKLFISRSAYSILHSKGRGKGSPYSITERRVPELIPVLGSQPAGNVSHIHGGRLPLLSARPAVTPATLRGLLPISLLGEHRHDGCEQFAKDCYPTESRLRFEPGPYCA